MIVRVTSPGAGKTANATQSRWQDHPPGSVLSVPAFFRNECVAPEQFPLVGSGQGSLQATLQPPQTTGSISVGWLVPQADWAVDRLRNSAEISRIWVNQTPS